MNGFLIYIVNIAALMGLNDLETGSKSHIVILWFAVAIIYLLIIIVILWGNRLKLKSKDDIIKSMQTDCNRLMELNSHTLNYEQLSNTTIDTFLSTIKDICTTKNRSKKIDRENFERIRESLFVNVAGNENFWKCLKDIVNAKHNNLISRMESTLTEADLRLLCLVGCGFTNNSILLLTTYTNQHSVSNRKRIIADKLHLDRPLEELFTMA